jgi:hypothetical protein
VILANMYVMSLNMFWFCDIVYVFNYVSCKYHINKCIKNYCLNLINYYYFADPNVQMLKMDIASKHWYK